MKLMSLNRCAVPDDLDAVTYHDHATEVDPESVGMTRQQVERIWKDVRSAYSTGFSPAITICLRRHGQVILNRAIGHARGNGCGNGVDYFFHRCFLMGAFLHWLRGTRLHLGEQSGKDLARDFQRGWRNDAGQDGAPRTPRGADAVIGTLPGRTQAVDRCPRVVGVDLLTEQAHGE